MVLARMKLIQSTLNIVPNIISEIITTTGGLDYIKIDPIQMI